MLLIFQISLQSFAVEKGILYHHCLSHCFQLFIHNCKSNITASALWLALTYHDVQCKPSPWKQLYKLNRNFPELYRLKSKFKQQFIQPLKKQVREVLRMYLVNSQLV